MQLFGVLEQVQIMQWCTQIDKYEVWELKSDTIMTYLWISDLSSNSVSFVTVTKGRGVVTGTAMHWTRMI